MADSLPRRTFSLAELLVGGVIISFLAFLLVPAVQASRETARRSQCTNNLKQIGLGLQNYADINKCFPPDALWGQFRGSRSDSSLELKQSAYHYPWSFNILPFIESRPRYHYIDKRIAIWNQSQEHGTGGVPKVKPPVYYGYIQAQQVPPYRCPSDAGFSGPSAMPGNCMWMNYAGSVGVGFYSAARKADDPYETETAAPVGTRGIFAFNEPATFHSIKDGASNTIAVAEVTSSSVATITGSGGRQFNSTLSADLDVAADSNQPLPPRWGVPGANPNTPWKPPHSLSGGAGKSRRNLYARGGYVPMVFRSALVALTESVSGSGPCSLPGAYSSAQGGPCGQGGSAADGTAGFELTGKIDDAPIVGIAPLYNALYGPNSNWPGPDSNHPGVVLAVFADGHTVTVYDDVDFGIWASLNSREGDE